MRYCLLFLLILLPTVSADIMFFYEGTGTYEYDETGIYIDDYHYSFFDYEGTLNVTITDHNVILSSDNDTTVGYFINRGRTNYNLVSLGKTYDEYIEVTQIPKTYSLIIDNETSTIADKPWYMKNLFAFEYNTKTLSDGTVINDVFEVPIIYLAIFIIMLGMLVWFFKK